MPPQEALGEVVAQPKGVQNVVQGRHVFVISRRGRRGRGIGGVVISIVTVVFVLMVVDIVALAVAFVAVATDFIAVCIIAIATLVAAVAILATATATASTTPAASAPVATATLSVRAVVQQQERFDHALRERVRGNVQRRRASREIDVRAGPPPKRIAHAVGHARPPRFVAGARGPRVGAAQHEEARGRHLVEPDGAAEAAVERATCAPFAVAPR